MAKMMQLIEENQKHIAALILPKAARNWVLEGDGSGSVMEGELPPSVHQGPLVYQRTQVTGKWLEEAREASAGGITVASIQNRDGGYWQRAWKLETGKLVVSLQLVVSEQRLLQQIKSEKMKVSTNKREKEYVSGLIITPKIHMEKPVGLVLERAQSIEGKGLVIRAELHKKKYVGLILGMAQSVEVNLLLKHVPSEANPISSYNETTPTFFSICKIAALSSIPKLVFNPSLNKKLGIPWVGATGYGVALDNIIIIFARLNSLFASKCGGRQVHYSEKIVCRQFGINLNPNKDRQRSEVERESQVDIIARHRLYTGVHEWRKLIYCFTEMKCLFGPFCDHLCNSENVFWKLGSMESSSRMSVLQRNYQSSDHFSAVEEHEDNVVQQLEKDKVISTSQASILAAEDILIEVGNEEDEQEDDVQLDGSPNGIEPHGEFQIRLSESTPLQTTTESRNPPVTNGTILLLALVVAPSYVPSEHGERIVLELPSSMVRPLKVLIGTFQITRRGLNVIVDNTESNDRGDGMDNMTANKIQKKDHSWLISSLHQIYSRRYLLRRSALELLMVDRSSSFDCGDTDGRRNAFRDIAPARPPHLNIIYLTTQGPEQILKRNQLMERGTTWEIHNFEYLMQRNTLAGRRYNDITQYPVFTWSPSNYNSHNLDLYIPASHGDLSKPIGASNADRLKKFQERYSNFDDQVIPKFHYGSHYATAGTMLHYLIRPEPFTTLSIQLQAGKFEHAERTFSDIVTTWNGVLEDMSDVKVLVPELFYLPEVLNNENSIGFGTAQLGGKLDSVQLLPWADNPADFIHKHLMTLKSEHVSVHLLEWIVIVIRYKQHGKEAIRASNVISLQSGPGASILQHFPDFHLEDKVSLKPGGNDRSPILEEPGRIEKNVQ